MKMVTRYGARPALGLAGYAAPTAPLSAADPERPVRVRRRLEPASVGHTQLRVLSDFTFHFHFSALLIKS